MINCIVFKTGNPGTRCATILYNPYVNFFTVKEALLDICDGLNKYHKISLKDNFSDREIIIKEWLCSDNNKHFRIDTYLNDHGWITPWRSTNQLTNMVVVENLSDVLLSVLSLCPEQQIKELTDINIILPDTTYKVE